MGRDYYDFYSLNVTGAAYKTISDEISQEDLETLTGNNKFVFIGTLVDIDSRDAFLRKNGVVLVYENDDNLLENFISVPGPYEIEEDDNRSKFVMKLHPNNKEEGKIVNDKFEFLGSGQFLFLSSSGYQNIGREIICEEEDNDYEFEFLDVVYEIEKEYFSLKHE